MSLQATMWVLEHAPTDDPVELLVLYALADRAGKDGSAAYPAQSWIAERARCHTRTVQRKLQSLERKGIIRRGDQSLVAQYRHDRQPVVWDLDLSLAAERPDTGVTPSTERHDTTVTPLGDSDTTGVSKRHDTGVRTTRQACPNDTTQVSERHDTGVVQTVLKPPLTVLEPKRLVQNKFERDPHHLNDASVTFDDFWNVVPRKAGKKEAKKAWAKAVKEADPDEIIEAMKKYRDDPNRSAEFTAHPSTWLNQGRWEDDPLPERTAKTNQNGATRRPESTLSAYQRALRQIRGQGLSSPQIDAQRTDSNIIDMNEWTVN